LVKETLTLIGYFPKIVARRPDWLTGAPIVEELCSVSDCFSESPPGWIEKWKHNEMFVYDTPELAWSVVSAEERQRFTLFAYRILPRFIDKGGETEWKLPNLGVSDLPDGFTTIGFDAVSRFAGSRFECSPLSCNHMASEYPVNKYCLIDDLKTAIAMAHDFAAGNCEPGPYCIIEVLRQKDSGRKVVNLENDALRLPEQSIKQ
jgi:hypothetical protein